MRGLPTIRSLTESLGALACLLGSGGCGSDGATGEPDPSYYAVVYGTVQQDEEPATGVEVRGEVYLDECPPVGEPNSSTGTRSGAGGRYRLLLTSDEPAAGQCLTLSVPGTSTVSQTLADTPFGATSPADVTDSVRIDLVLP